MRQGSSNHLKQVRPIVAEYLSVLNADTVTRYGSGFCLAHISGTICVPMLIYVTSGFIMLNRIPATRYLRRRQSDE